VLKVTEPDFWVPLLGRLAKEPTIVGKKAVEGQLDEVV
jgi:hypothetical protein